jgi:tetratricopeptide (TPR) repeat protein
LRYISASFFRRIGRRTTVLCGAALFFAACGTAWAADSLRIEQNDTAYIGCEVILSLAGKEASVPGAVYEWTFEGNAKAIQLRRGGLECRFTPNDVSPVAASVSALDSGGTLLASVRTVLTAQPFAVDILLIEPSPFLLWDAFEKKDAAAPGLIAGEPVRFELKLTPEYKGTIVSRWNADASTAILDKRDKGLTVVRNDIGEGELSIVVADSKGIILGSGQKKFDVIVSRARVERSIQQKKAWLQWTKSLEQWEAKDFDAALAAGKAAVEIDPENGELTDAFNAMSANHVRLERARRLASDADALRKDQKLGDSLKLYRRSYAAWPLDGTEVSVQELEREIDSRRRLAQRVEWLKDIATGYDQENLFEDALKYYKEALFLIPDEAVAQRVDRIEKRLDSVARAKAFAEEGRALEKEKRFQDALSSYRESLKLDSNGELDRHAKELDGVIQERRTRAASLRREGSDLQKRNENAQALLRYRESQELWPSPDLEKRIASMEESVGQTSPQEIRSPEDFGIGTQADAQRYLRAGHDLYREGKYREALEQYRKSYAISKDRPLRAWIERVETPLREYEAVQQANALIKKGNDSYNGGQISEAITAYKESLSVHANTEVENFVRHLELELKSADVSAVSVIPVASR